MILQALNEYYDRKAADAESSIAPLGWEWKEISFIIVLDKKGSFLRFEDTREGEGAKKRGKSFLVPQGVKKTSGVAANLLWDNAVYILGIANTDKLNASEKEKKLSRLPEQKKAFLDRIKNELPESPGKKAVLAFLSSLDISALEKEPQWEDIYQTNPNMSLRIDGEYRLYCQSDEVKKALADKTDADNDSGICLITGEKESISTLHTAIKGVWGAQTSGANIVSFNLDAFRSFGKKQGQNSPVGKTAMFAYTTALNDLLDRNSSQRMQIGDASTVFWSARQTQFEHDLAIMLAEPAQEAPEARADCIKNLFDSANTGAYLEDPSEEKFFVLGLSPNASRISVRFWLKGTVGEFAGNIRKHFNDLEIVKPKTEPPYYSLWRLLVNTAVQDKSENIAPNIAGDFMRSILNGTPYPATLLQAVLRRIKSDTANRVKPVRAALIKAYLNRLLRSQEIYNEKEVLQVGLDTNQKAIGYNLGRLFAVLEKIQEDAIPDLKATIRDRYYGAACSCPSLVFPTLMKLATHHLTKLWDKKGLKINREKLIASIVANFDNFPPFLDLHEQGKFAIGYYHQRQIFYTKKENASSDDLGEANETT
ncbi:MAG: type I-C CRISPR-associated protein Cas8c/Csd1 [Spirochaetes bacterium]|nr:type I-C CRISPR-associated protein Cas8c/Csd1 [Spirochaetota bacterium]